MNYCKSLIATSLLMALFLSSFAQKISKIDSVRALHKPSRAILFSAIIPGAGQVYNKKYWKVPIVYGLLGGLGYATYYNHDKYQYYKNALANANSAGPYNYYFSGQLSAIPVAQRKAVLGINKDNFRRSRDLDVIFFFVSYIANVIDAGVDAYFMTYDIGTELALGVQPKMMNVVSSPYMMGAESLTSNAVGLSLTLRFK